MTPDHLNRIDNLDQTARLIVLRNFRILDRDEKLSTLILRRNLDHAAVVMCLLHANMRADVEYLINKPILICPNAMPPRLPHIVRMAQRTGDDRRIKRVCVDHNPWQTPPSRARFALIKAGMSLRDILARGVTRRDLRRALRRQWITVENTVTQ